MSYFGQQNRNNLIVRQWRFLKFQNKKIFFYQTNYNSVHENAGKDINIELFSVNQNFRHWEASNVQTLNQSADKIVLLESAESKNLLGNGHHGDK